MTRMSMSTGKPLDDLLKAGLSKFGAVKVIRSWFAPGNGIIHSADPGMLGLGGSGTPMVFVHPWFNLVTGEYRPPFYTRMCLGVREAERDRRLRKVTR